MTHIKLTEIYNFLGSIGYRKVWLKFYRLNFYSHICVEYNIINILCERRERSDLDRWHLLGGMKIVFSYNIYAWLCSLYIYISIYIYVVRICWTNVIVLWKLGKAYCLTSGDKRAGVHNVREGRIKHGRATYWSSVVWGVWEVEGR